MIELDYTKVKETKTCYVFQTGEKGTKDFQTLYLKKATVDAAGINPSDGIKVTVEQK